MNRNGWRIFWVKNAFDWSWVVNLLLLLEIIISFAVRSDIFLLNHVSLWLCTCVLIGIECLRL